MQITINGIELNPAASLAVEEAITLHIQEVKNQSISGYRLAPHVQKRLDLLDKILERFPKV